jgi:hypothetical protein
LLNPLVVLDGTAVQIRGKSWEPSSHVTIEEELHLHPTLGLLDVEDITPTPSLLDDGDVEPHLGPVNLAHFEEPSNQIAWLQWIKQHIQQRDGPNGWFRQYCLKFPDITEDGKKVYKGGHLILYPRERWNLEIRRLEDSVTQHQLIAIK